MQGCALFRHESRRKQHALCTAVHPIYEGRRGASTFSINAEMCVMDYG